MRILLDHCVDRNVRQLLPGHEVKTAVEMGWDRLKNGELIAAAAHHFDVLATTEKNMRYQQNLDKLPISILEMNVPRNRFKELVLLAPYLPAALEATQRFRFVSVHIDGRIEALAPRP